MWGCVTAQVTHLATTRSATVKLVSLQARNHRFRPTAPARIETRIVIQMTFSPRHSEFFLRELVIN